MAKRAGQYHNQLLLQAKSRKSLQALLKNLLPTLSGNENKRIHWSLDIDPIELS